MADGICVEVVLGSQNWVVAKSGTVGAGCLG